MIPESYLLSRDVAKKAVDIVRPVILAGRKSGVLEDGNLHVVIMNPVARPHHVTNKRKAILYEESFGQSALWKYPLDEIARAKAFESWRTGLSTHEIVEARPYLLQADDGHADTVYYGSVVLEGIAVGVSGGDPHVDEMLAHMIAAACRALCIEAMQKLKVERGRNFVWERKLDGQSDGR